MPCKGGCDLCGGACLPGYPVTVFRQKALHQHIQRRYRSGFTPDYLVQQSGVPRPACHEMALFGCPKKCTTGCRKSQTKRDCCKSFILQQSCYDYASSQLKTFLQSVQPSRVFICSSWLLMVTVVQGATDLVINALAPITEPWPITVSPPSTEVPA